MKTVFKVGMEVYDQVFFGKTPLKITEVKGDMSLRVLYGEVTYCYTGDGRFIGDDITSNRWRPLSQTPTLSTSPYTLQGFEQKEPVPTYEEAEEWIRKESEKGNIFLMNKDVLEALRRLVILRDYYNEGWKPDWKDGSYKEILCFEADFHSKIDFKYRFYASKSEPRVLAFKNSEIRKRFFEEQKELLEIAKPLL